MGTVLEFDINTIMFSLECTTEPDDSKFANQAALANGVVLRKKTVDGFVNIWNVKTNGEFANLASVEYTDKAGGGNFGVRVSMSYNDESSHGTTFRVSPGEALQLLIQDDLTAATLLKFRAIAQGRVVEEIIEEA